MEFREQLVAHDREHRVGVEVRYTLLHLAQLPGQPPGGVQRTW